MKDSEQARVDAARATFEAIRTDAYERFEAIRGPARDHYETFNNPPVNGMGYADPNDPGWEQWQANHAGKWEAYLAIERPAWEECKATVNAAVAVNLETVRAIYGVAE